VQMSQIVGVTIAQNSACSAPSMLLRMTGWGSLNRATHIVRPVMMLEDFMGPVFMCFVGTGQWLILVRIVNN